MKALNAFLPALTRQNIAMNHMKAQSRQLPHRSFRNLYKFPSIFPLSPFRENQNENSNLQQNLLQEIFFEGDKNLWRTTGWQNEI